MSRNFREGSESLILCEERVVAGKEAAAEYWKSLIAAGSKGISFHEPQGLGVQL